LKTSIDLPAPLVARAKALAGERGESLSAFIGEAVEAHLAQSESGRRKKPSVLSLPCHRMGKPMVCLDSREALFRAMEQ
jgi:hypothetical protein